MNWKARFLYSQNWNIGFCEQTPEDLIRDKKLSKVRWLKHPYRDRWFADPFIYKVTKHDIIVFVEECMVSDSPKGIICELVIDRKTMRLKERYVMLELDTHLSYPAIIRHEGIVYVYPENGASGSLKMYRYDEENHRLVDPMCILKDAVADSTILSVDDSYYIIATKSKESKKNAYLYQSKDLFGEYKLVNEFPVQTNRSCSRPAGNWITVSNHLYRPAQDCSKSYGGAINIMCVDTLAPFYEEKTFCIKPEWFNYNFGTHTINFYKEASLTVIDAYGYLHPHFARIWTALSSLKVRILNKK